jgi:site-specific DNA-methyltransferase (adenine-specific)
MVKKDILRDFPVADIIPYERNCQKHDKNVQDIANSLRDFGYLKISILIDENNVLIAGHGTVEAAKMLKWEVIPEVCRVMDMPEDMKKAYRIADNSSAKKAEWDFGNLDIELKSLEGFNFNMTSYGLDYAMVYENPDVDEDDIPPAPEAPRTKRGDIYELGNHRLICGDSTSKEDIVRLMNGRTADMVLTDPPYNVDYGGGMNKKTGQKREDRKIKNDHIGNDDFLAFLTAAFRAADTALKAGGVFYIWHSDSERYNFQSACNLTGWKVRQCLIWNKNTIVLGRQDYQWKHEPCLYGWKSGAAHYFVDSRRNRTIIDGGIDLKKLEKDELLSILQSIIEENEAVSTTVIDEDKPVRSEEHPTMKPVRLLALLINNSTRSGELILDPFGGSGSTMIAAHKYGRASCLVELDERFCDVIVTRYLKFAGQKTVILNGQKVEWL